MSAAVLYGLGVGCFLLGVAVEALVDAVRHGRLERSVLRRLRAIERGEL